MKKIIIALILVLSLFVVSACGNTVTPQNDGSVDTGTASGSDTSLSDSDTSVSDGDASVSDSDEIPAPEGYIGCVVGDLYFCYPESYKATTVSGSDLVTVSAGSAGASISVAKYTDADINVSELSKTDLDEIGEKGAAATASGLGEGIEAVYSYNKHGTTMDGKGVYFAFDITVSHADKGLSQKFSYYQLYIGEGADLYIATFASNPKLDGSIASEYFADVIESMELRIAE